MRALVWAALTLAAGCGEKDSPLTDSGPPGLVPDEDGDGVPGDEDCDDNNPDVYPGAPEDDCADPVDYNCDGEVGYADGDGDGFAACEDCDDSDPSVFPGAQERCDGVDQDCDGVVDSPNPSGGALYYADLDGDGFGDPDNSATACGAAPSGYVEDDSDCDDGADHVHPGAEELCDGLDTDCDGVIGETLIPGDYASLQAALDAGEPEVCLDRGAHAGGVTYTLTQDLRITGVDRVETVLDGGGAATVLQLEASGQDLIVENLTLRGGLGTGGFAGGLIVEGGREVTLQGLSVVGNTCAAQLCRGAGLTVTEFEHAALVDVELTENTLEGVPMGSLALLFGQSVSLDGVQIHGELAASTGGVEGYASALLVRLGAVDGQGLYDGVVQLNGVEIYDNVGEASHALYSTATFHEVGSLEIRNSRFVDNTVSSTQNRCGVPGFFPFEVVEGQYNNVEIVGNRCAESVETYAPGFFHYGYPDASASTARLQNVIIAGNSANSDRGRVWAGAILEGRTQAGYRNVSVHGNEVTSARNYGGWVLSERASLTLLNVDYSGNVIRATGGSDLATGFADLDGDGSLAVRYSNLRDLGATPVDGGLTDPRGQNNNLNVSPGYSDVSGDAPSSWDLTLSPRSALINVGSIVISDPDGSRSDIGAYGGPGASDW